MHAHTYSHAVLISNQIACTHILTHRPSLFTQSQRIAAFQTELENAAAAAAATAAAARQTLLRGETKLMQAQRDTRRARAAAQREENDTADR
jgi:hypothetical protein